MTGAVSHATIRRKIGVARSSRPPLRDSDFVSDLFARLLEERLRVSLGGPVSVSIGAPEMMKLTAALDIGDEPALYGVAETRADLLGGVLTLSAPLVHRVVEAMTGAPRAEASPDRMPTAIDEALIAGFAEDVIDSFERAVTPGPRPDGGLAINFSRFARKATSLTEAPDDLDTLAFRLTLGLGDGVEPSSFTFVTPLGILDIYQTAEKAAASKRSLIGVSSAPEGIWASTMLTAAQVAEYRLISVLHEMTLTVSEIGELTPGAVLPLPSETRMQVRLRVDTPKGVAGAPDLAEGALGVVDGRRAIKITAPPDEEFIGNIRPYAARR